jgi:tripartite-type tricarboxylate transporter receptor subunit TctC
LLAPKGTPASVLERLRKETAAVLSSNEVKGYMAQNAMEAYTDTTPAQFDAFFREERERWAKIIQETGAKVD